MTLARELYPEVSLRAKGSNIHKDELRRCLKLAAAANALDFFKNPDSIRDDIREPVSFVLDDSEQLAAKLKDASRVLCLADNAWNQWLSLVEPGVGLPRRSAFVLTLVSQTYPILL